MPIEITDLNYTYNKKSPFSKNALKNINLTINDGEFFGLIGHTGSGKSTLISHLNALTRIQDGKIVVDGMDLSPKKLDFKRLRSIVGMVFQYPEYQLFDETVAKDVAFGPRNLKLDKDEIEVRVKEAMEAVGLEYLKYAERSPFELSGGEKRRAAIAGVLAMRPKILVLDEPTAGLDPRGKKEILALVKKLKETMCPTVVMISHNMDEIAEMCTRIGVMSDGELKAVVEPKELFSNMELLHSLNISMPLVTETANALADAGLSVRRDVITEDELVAELDSALGKRRETSEKGGGKDA